MFILIVIKPTVNIFFMLRFFFKFPNVFKVHRLIGNVSIIRRIRRYIRCVLIGLNIVPHLKVNGLIWDVSVASILE